MIEVSTALPSAKPLRIASLFADRGDALTLLQHLVSTYSLRRRLVELTTPMLGASIRRGRAIRHLSDRGAAQRAFGTVVDVGSRRAAASVGWPSWYEQHRFSLGLAAPQRCVGRQLGQIALPASNLGTDGWAPNGRPPKGSTEAHVVADVGGDLPVSVMALLNLLLLHRQLHVQGL